MKLSKVKKNPSNPRVVKDEKFAKLVNSIKEFPKMMELRPMVVSDDWVVLGGNMRLKALQELGYKDIPDNWVKQASDLTEEEQKRFIIADNVGFGDWDFDMLRNDFDVAELDDWGLTVFEAEDIDLDDFFEEQPEQEDVEEKHKIILEYSEEEYHQIQEAIKSDGRTFEAVLFDALV